MKKLLKIAICAFMIAGVVACGGKDDTDAQKAVVENFLSCFTKADIEGAQALCTDDNSFMSSMSRLYSSLDAYKDTDKYGEKWVSELNKYLETMFSKIISESEITDVKTEDDKTVVSVKVKTLDVSSMSSSMSDLQKEISEYSQQYAKDHMSELQEIYKKDGQAGVEKALYDALAEDVLNKVIEKFDEQAKPIEGTLTFTLVADGDSYKISSIY